MKSIYKISLLLLIISIQLTTYAQKIKGKVSLVSVKDGKDVVEPLVNATVFWAGTAVGTVTDDQGRFIINKPNSKSNLLVSSFIGCKSDTLKVDKEAEVNFILKDNATLNEIVVSERLGGTFMSTLSPIQTSTITTAGLQKLACCNLSESFQNNATVDVGFSDAVSGAKQIQMLGLAGVYSQLMTENMPSIRGLGAAYGLNFIPGSWMESIQISKGTSSVVNGYESVTGQINVEMKKPEKSEPLFLNLYASDEGRVEGNLTSAVKLNNKLTTSVLAHGSFLKNKVDHNMDGFLDMPMNELYNVANRWRYDGERMHSISMINLIDEKRQGGQASYYDAENNGNAKSYGIGVDTKRYSFFSKNGFMFEKPETSLGIQISGTYHKQNSFFGLNKYDGLQKSLYANLIFETILGNTNHKLTSGLSYLFDNYVETMTQSLNQTNFKRTEKFNIPGVFTQYTYSVLDKFNLIIGFRLDKFNDQIFATPRIHTRYDFGSGIIFRASAGKGYRNANVIVENIGMLASSRKINIASALKPEEAWNYGVNVTKEFQLKEKRKATLTIDFYRTDFIEQVIADFDRNVHQADFYNLSTQKGAKSYSNSFQTEFTIEPFKRFEFTTAFRYNDVKTTINNQLVERPFVGKYKGLVTLSYATRFDKWKFDFTSQFNGGTRLPDTKTNPAEFQREAYSPEYIMLFAQITRKFKHFDVYVGGENLTNYVQHHPIVDHENPFGSNFDASMIWGPISSRMFYVGMRLTIK